MPTNSTTPVSSAFPTTSARTVDGITHIDLNFASAMSKGTGTIFVTDGAMRTVIDRVTGQPKLRVVGATFTKEISLDAVSISGTHAMFDIAGLPAGASLNVYMGAGTLLSGGKPAGAITVPGSAAFTTPVIVVEPPPPGGLNATIELDGNSLKSGEDIAVTITFDKAVENLSIDALVAANADISYLTAFDGGKTWIATLTGKATTDAPSNVLRLDLGAVVAADGTRGSGVKESNAYLVDTIVAAYVGTSIELDDDAGPSRYDGVSNEDTMSVSGLLYGSMKTGESIELKINGRTIDPAQIAITSTYSSGVHKWTYTNEAEYFNVGGSTVQVRVVGGAHSSQTATKSILIDQDAPDIIAKPTAPIDATKAITITFNERMYWEDNVEVTRDIRVVDAFGNTSWIDLEESNLSLDGKTLTLSAGEHKLATGNSYAIYLPAGLTDLAGNSYDGPAVNVSTSGLYQDKAPPRLLQTYIVNGNGVYGEGDVLEFRLRFSEKVNLQAGVELKLNLSNGKIATYVGLVNDGTEMSFTYTVGAEEDSAGLDTYTVWSVVGKVHDDAGNVLQNSHIEYDGSLTTENGYGADVEIDTLVTQPGAPRLHADSDSGTLGDNSTTDTTPRLSGSGAEAHASISIYGGDLLIGSATADASGQWDTVVTTALDVGTHQIRVVQRDPAGNLSEVSTALALTITAGAPPAGLAAPTLDPLSDSGVFDDDGLTNTGTPTITGKGPASTTLTLMLDGADLATVDTNAGGDWSYQPTAALGDGVHSFSVRQGSGSASPALSITVDKGRPSVSASPDGATALPPGAAIVITFSEAVHIAAAEGDSDMLVLRDYDDNVRKFAVSDANLSSDKRSLTISAADLALLGLKDYAISLPTTLTDLAGNSMSEYQIHFRTASDGLPTAIRAIHSGDGSFRAGETITFRIVFNEDIARVGSGELSLGLSNGGKAMFTGISGREASFDYTVAAGQDGGDVYITGTSTLPNGIADLSGNPLDAAHIQLGDMLYNGSGYGSRIDIDTVAPTRPAAPLLHAGSNSGNVADLLTNDRTPTLTGSGAEANAKIELYEGDTLIDYSYADDEGNWSVTVESGQALSDGAHSLTVMQVDEAGNRSTASLPLALTIDATVAALDAPQLLAGSDTGSSATDKLINLARPVLAGSGAEAGATIKILSGETLVGFGNADAYGAWQAALIDGLQLTDGVYRFTARQEDNAGNLGALSSELVFTVDRTAPAAPGRPLLDAGSDSGMITDDGITNIVTPTFTGSGAAAGATVVLFAGTREIGRKVADGAGNWSLTVLDADKFTTNGSYAITAKQIDDAGNLSDASSAFTLVIDTAAPVLSTASTNQTAKEFRLFFNEKISFHPSGDSNLKQNTSILSFFKTDTTNWYTSSGDGGADSVLHLKISLSGLFNLYMNNDVVKDVAGNVSLIGTREYLIDLLDGSSS